MKKICYLLCIFILTGCSKKLDTSPTINPTNAVITYNFSASVSGTYSIYYFNFVNFAQPIVQFTGKTWSETYTIDNVSSYPNGYGIPLEMSITTTTPGASYTLTISINNQVKSTSNGIFISNDPVAYVGYNYVILH